MHTLNKDILLANVLDLSSLKSHKIKRSYWISFLVDHPENCLTLYAIHHTKQCILNRLHLAEWLQVTVRLCPTFNYSITIRGLLNCYLATFPYNFSNSIFINLFFIQYFFNMLSFFISAYHTYKSTLFCTEPLTKYRNI